MRQDTTLDEKNEILSETPQPGWARREGQSPACLLNIMYIIGAQPTGLGKLTAARALYQLCRDVGVPRAVKRHKVGDLGQWTQGWLGGTLGIEIARLIADGGRIVQETVGVELLATVDTAPLFAF